MSFTLSSELEINLTSSNINLQINQKFANYPGMLFTVNKCSVEGFFCTVTKNGNDNVFSLTANSIPTGTIWRLTNKIFVITFWVNGDSTDSSTTYTAELLAYLNGAFYVVNECTEAAVIFFILVLTNGFLGLEFGLSYCCSNSSWKSYF